MLPPGSRGRPPAGTPGARPAPRPSPRPGLLELDRSCAAGRAAAARPRARRAPGRVADEVTITGMSGPTRAAHASRAASRCGFVDQVRLGQREDPRERGQPRVVQLELVLDRLVVVDRIGSVERLEVEHVDEQPGALDVRQELVPEPGAAAGALDQPGNVGDHELAVVGLERPERGLERRERVVGDLGVRARQARQQRRLAGVWQPDQADVGDQLELQRDPVSSPGSPRSANRGVWWVGPAKRLFPRPPARHAPSPPADRAHQVVHGAVRLDARLGPGRHRDRRASRRPRRGAAIPARGRPRPALKCDRRRNASRSRSESSHTSTTSPPRPPSPPFGPPFGTCASRRKLRQPSPPPPA